MCWVLKIQVISNNLGQWQGRKKTNQKNGFPPWLDWVSLVHLLSSAVGALVWFQILFTLFYFLSPPSLPREWSKLRSTQPWKRKGLFGGVIQSIVCSTSALVLYFFFRLLSCERSELQLLSAIFNTTPKQNSLKLAIVSKSDLWKVSWFQNNILRLGRMIN